MACRKLASSSDGREVLIELAARVGELTNKNGALIGENNRLTAEIGELTGRNKNLESQVMKLLEQNSNFNKKIETLTKRLAEMESKNSEEVVSQAKKQKKT